jgi:hypothetical protein
MGCTDSSACNFDENATIDDDNCTYPQSNYNCEGNCILQAQASGIDDDGDDLIDEDWGNGFDDDGDGLIDEDGLVLDEGGLDCSGECSGIPSTTFS